MVALLSSTPPDHRILRNPLRPSGYACVYLKRDGREQYAVRAFRHIHVGNYPTPSEAANAAAEWWYRTYGPEWDAFFKCRSRLAWHAIAFRGPATVLHADGAVSTASVGYRLVCWELGTRRPVFPPPTRSGPCPTAFATRAFAKRHFRQWRIEEYGALHPLILRRTSRVVEVPAWARARGGSGLPSVD